MDREPIREWLDRNPVIRSACDLELLLLFARHPRVLFTTDELATRLLASPREDRRAIMRAC